MKTIILSMLMLFITISTLAQPNREKIKALKVAFITDKLDLTEKEAQQFWPIYNAYEKENSKSRKQFHENRNAINWETLDEKQAKDLIKEMSIAEDKRHIRSQKYMVDLQQVLPAKKIILLKKAEDDFKRQMMDHYKKRQQRKNKP